MVVANLPPIEKYVEAFNKIKADLTLKNLAMLKANYHAIDHTISAFELGKAAGYKDHRGVNRQTARIGKMLASHLKWPLPLRSDGSEFPSAFLVDWKEHDDGWYCTLYPEVVEALKIVGLA
jgi:hypothetical protein